MASAIQDVLNSGGSNSTSGNLVGWRDANASLSVGSLFGDSGRSSATSGDIKVGDRIIGGSSQGFKIGLVKMLAMGALVAIVLKIWKGKK